MGLPLAIGFHGAGFVVRAFDVDSKKVPLLRAGKSYLRHIPSREIKAMTFSGRFVPTDDSEWKEQNR